MSNCTINGMVFLVILFGSLFARYISIRLKKSKKRRKNKSKTNLFSELNWLIGIFLLVAIGFLAFSFYAPKHYTGGTTFSGNTGYIGDTIGGLMNPFIAIAGVIVTGLAFYMQIKANLLQRRLFKKQLAGDKRKSKSDVKRSNRQFQMQLDAQNKQNKLQQFEAQFYEMLRLHKENVNEIEIPAKRNVGSEENPTYETFTVTKRNAFVEFKKEFETILNEIKNSDLETINKSSFEEAYSWFFWGLDNHFDNEEQRSMAELFDDDNSLLNKLYEIKFRQYETHSPFEPNAKFSIIAFEGHSTFLGHYYRHLFHTVKFVARQKEEFLPYYEKIKYLKVLRAQLSNHEQIMLFYNWLGGLGEPWEDEKNKFFTEYSMIHNLWYDIISKDPFVVEKIEELKNAIPKMRKGKMFEIDGKAI